MHIINIIFITYKGRNVVLYNYNYPQMKIIYIVTHFYRKGNCPYSVVNDRWVNYNYGFFKFLLFMPCVISMKCLENSLKNNETNKQKWPLETQQTILTQGQAYKKNITTVNHYQVKAMTVIGQTQTALQIVSQIHIRNADERVTVFRITYVL